MASDIVLGDDGTLRFVGDFVNFGRSSAGTAPVGVTGTILLVDRAYVNAPPKPPPATPGMSPVAAWTGLAGGLAPSAPAGLVLSPELRYPILRTAKPPYDIYQMLEALRLAVLDLNNRLGG